MNNEKHKVIVMSCVEVMTKRSSEEVKKAIKVAVIKGLDKPPNYISLPKDTKVTSTNDMCPNFNTTDKIIKRFLNLIKQYEKEDPEHIAVAYYKAIVNFLRLETKYKEIVELSGKPIAYYFRHHLPKIGEDYFLWLYSVHNPVRFSVETFRSIKEIDEELRKNDK